MAIDDLLSGLHLNVVPSLKPTPLEKPTPTPTTGARSQDKPKPAQEPTPASPSGQIRPKNRQIGHGRTPPPPGEGVVTAATKASMPSQYPSADPDNIWPKWLDHLEDRVLRKALDGDDYMLRWILERRRPERWALKEVKKAAAGKDTKPKTPTSKPLWEQGSSLNND